MLAILGGAQCSYKNCSSSCSIHVSPRIAIIMRTLLCIFGCLFGFMSAQNSPLTWDEIDYTGDWVPDARSGAHMAYDSFGDCLYMFGGGVDNYMWKFDIARQVWSILHNGSNPAPVTRKYAYYGVVRFGGREATTGESLFVISHGIGAAEYDDTWVFSTRSNTWREVETTGPRPSIRYGGHFGVFNNSDELWMGGGFTLTTSLASRYIDTYILRFTSEYEAIWMRVHDQPSIGNQFDPLAPHGRCLQGSAVVEDDKIVLWGGCMRGGSGGGPCPADDSWYFNNDDGTWTELPRCATPRVWSAMAPITDSPGKAILYGGSTEWSEQVISAVDWPEEEVLVVDVNDNSWTRYATEASDGQYPYRRFDHTMAAGPNGDVYLFSGKLLSNSSLLNDLWVLRGVPEDTEAMDCDLGWVSIPHVHGLLMALAFGILFPTGFFVARFFRCKGPGKVSKVWFICHVVIQLSALVITIPAFIIIFYAGASVEPTHPHAIIGIILMFLMVLQPINGIFRPHIKADKEKSCIRIIWEWFHRIYGIFVILVGLTQVSLGVFLIVPPRPVWIVWILVLFGWVIGFTVLEVIRCMRIVFCSESPDESQREVEMKQRNTRKLSSFNQ